MSWPAPHPNVRPLPLVPVEDVNPGDMILLGGRWRRVDNLWPDGPRVTVLLDGRAVPYETGQKVTVLRVLPQQATNPVFLDTLGPAVFRSTLLDRLLDRLGRRRRRT